jgi:FkbM family methyltransferase
MKLIALERLGRPVDAAALRAELIARHPAFAPDRLRRIVILGAAEEGQRLAGICVSHGIAITAVLDDNPRRQGTRVADTAVQPTTALATIDRDVPLVIASHRVLLALDRLGAAASERPVAPLALLQAAWPERFPPHMFHDGLLEDLATSRDRYRALADALADDLSRRVLDAVIGYRLTMDAELLRPFVDWGLYQPTGLPPLRGDEVYVDGGAFDGDSVRLFIKRVGDSYTRILAFEPDPATFRRLAANFAGESRVEPVNAGLYSHKTVLRFDDAGTRGSLLAEGGGVEVPVVALDEVLKGDRVTTIKMNIEGAELDALEGARHAIQRWRPRLAISAYHRPSDLWRIPEAIRALDPGYRLHYRQHDGGIIETVCYAVAGTLAA